jgi:hypothetical protein
MSNREGSQYPREGQMIDLVRRTLVTLGALTSFVIEAGRAQPSSPRSASRASRVASS